MITLSPPRRSAAAASPSVLGGDPEPGRGLAPDAVEIGADGLESFAVEAVDPTRPTRLLDDEASLLEQPQMPRYRRSTDRHHIGEVLNRSTLGPARRQQLDDPTPIGIPQGLERVACPLRRVQIALILLFLASWVSSASPSASSNGGM
jgi:hypothetical protein